MPGLDRTIKRRRSYLRELLTRACFQLETATPLQGSRLFSPAQAQQALQGPPFSPPSSLQVSSLPASSPPQPPSWPEPPS